MNIVFALLHLVLTLYWYSLLVRVVYDVVQSFARQWRPRGISLILASAVYTVTDPPIRWLRSKIPPLNLGGIGLDVAFLVVFIVVILLRALVPLQ
ncbi:MULTISPECIES: YggT family protein [Auritidibacter]|uniref:YggT family protein n=1 Tax=Auritidibacter TaxID=1160973 RepID=UPI000D72FE7B|nr:MULTISPECIES: YggT family protein [Auritidibacter]PXA78004.1 YggT family protein [Auritidibacter sp. NML120779]AXR73700.1 YggT family protein [Auritidibacter sp. NML130574]NIH70377.1 YggT family protein [Auritidibacter ignavus]PXA76396.1 YggT family protein [Auritidibacter sp. NML100628]PXA81376.1 YggT family protein [Auritidibacter sp. NML120636]